MMKSHDFCISYVPLDVILPLREAVIIAGTNRDTPYFSGDDAPDTLHAGVVEHGQCIGCATVLRSKWESSPVWQLRGMAVAADRQRCGIGSAVLNFLESTLPEKAPAVGVWCNAREKAVPFYVKAGFNIVSDRFLIEGVGPHYRLFKAFPNQHAATVPNMV